MNKFFSFVKIWFGSILYLMLAISLITGIVRYNMNDKTDTYTVIGKSMGSSESGPKYIVALQSSEHEFHDKEIKFNQWTRLDVGSKITTTVNDSSDLLLVFIFVGVIIWFGWTIICLISASEIGDSIDNNIYRTKLLFEKEISK